MSTTRIPASAPLMGRSSWCSEGKDLLEPGLIVDDGTTKGLERRVERDLSTLGESDDSDALLVHLRVRREEPQRIGVIGFSKGGQVALYTDRKSTRLNSS